MQDFSSLSPIIPAASHKDGPLQTPKLHVRSADYAPPGSGRRSWLQRLTSWFARLFMPRVVASAVVIPPVCPMLAHPGMSPSPVAFKAGAAVTLISPIGSYAGKSSNDTLRKMAEHQFHHMEISHETAIN